jgi:hypothetical protein
MPCAAAAVTRGIDEAVRPHAPYRYLTPPCFCCVMRSRSLRQT